jgi:hypothetical protein
VCANVKQRATRKSMANIPTPVVVRGQHFSSVSKCAKFFGVADSTVTYHLDNGTLDKLGMSGRPKNNCHPITIYGVTYPSRTAAYRTLNIGHQEFYKLLKDGKLPSTGDMTKGKRYGT